jgi:hypothetical protein
MYHFNKGKKNKNQNKELKENKQVEQYLFPNDIWIIVFKFLNPNELCFLLINKSLYELTKTNLVWNSILEKDGFYISNEEKEGTSKQIFKNEYERLEIEELPEINIICLGLQLNNSKTKNFYNRTLFIEKTHLFFEKNDLNHPLCNYSERKHVCRFSKNEKAFTYIIQNTLDGYHYNLNNDSYALRQADIILLFPNDEEDLKMRMEHVTCHFEERDKAKQIICCSSDIKLLDLAKEMNAQIIQLPKNGIIDKKTTLLMLDQIGEIYFNNMNNKPQKSPIYNKLKNCIIS